MALVFGWWYEQVSTSGSELTITPSKSSTNTSAGSLGRGRLGAAPAAAGLRRACSCTMPQGLSTATMQVQAQARKGGNSVVQQTHTSFGAHQLVRDDPVELSSGVNTVCVAAGDWAAAPAAPCEVGTAQSAAIPVHVPARLRAARLGLPYQPMGLANGGHANCEGQGSASKGYSQAAGRHGRALCIALNAQPARAILIGHQPTTQGAAARCAGPAGWR